MLLYMPFLTIADAIADAIAAKPSKQVMRTLSTAASIDSDAALRPRFRAHTIDNDSPGRDFPMLARQLSSWRALQERGHV